MLKPDGNGGFNISRANTITLGLALTLIGMVAGLAVTWGTQMQALGRHDLQADVARADVRAGLPRRRAVLDISRDELRMEE